MAKKQTSQAANTKTADERTGSEILDSIFDKMASRYTIPSNEIATILRQTAFKAEDGKEEATPAEMKALLVVAEKYNLNPFIREIFAFRNKKGVLIPVVSVDGWIKIMNNHEQHAGFKFNYSDNMIEVGKSKKCFEWIEIEIYRKDRLDYPIPIREYLDECYIGRGYTSPWDTHTKRMLRHKTLSQGVRVAYGVNDVYDLDEAERIDDALEAEINREKELEKPESAEDISPVEEPITDAPAAEAPPKVLNEIPKEKQTAPAKKEKVKDPEPVTEPEPEPEAIEEKEEAVQDDLFTEEKPKENKKEEKKEAIPDIF